MDEITLMSFGYLYGLPEEADTVIGVRGLPNPYYVEELKHKTGLYPEVQDYVFSTAESEAFFQSTLDLLRRRIAFHAAYDSPLKKPLVIALGCSGGKHRSVSMAERLAAALGEAGCGLRVLHRDLEKKLEHSAGAVVFTREAGEPRFVIVQSRTGGHHSFPKGHMEPGETETQTALREIREETGLRPALCAGFRTVEFYKLPNKTNIWKQVMYFLAEYRDQPIRTQQSELRCAALLSFEEALSALEHESSRRVLKEAYAFLNQSLSIVNCQL